MSPIVGGEMDDPPELAIERMFRYRQCDSAEVQRATVGGEGHYSGCFAGHIDVRLLDPGGKVTGLLTGSRRLRRVFGVEASRLGDPFPAFGECYPAS